jgi:tRNA(Ile)-lysidine synthase
VSIPIASSVPSARLSPTSTPDPVWRAALALAVTLRESRQPLVLAVSGGCDSMVLMDALRDAVQSVGGDAGERLSVATFDHGTGQHASDAVALVASEARQRGLDVRVGKGSLPGASEADWRIARWSFLRDVAQGAVVATAHTRDDQLETVVMRVIRGSGPRGLAALEASRSGVIRPFLGVSRAEVRRYATEHDVRFVDDPSNESPAHFRNRVRHDLLPAILRLSPRFADEMLSLAGRAASWRAAVDELAGTFAMKRSDDGAIRVARHELTTYDSAALCVLWPAIAARAGITLDRRGTRRLAQFTSQGAPGARIQVSGGTEVVRERDTFAFRALATPIDTVEMRLDGVVELDGWRFSPVTPLPFAVSHKPDAASSTDMLRAASRPSSWTCDLPLGSRLSVRSWRAGDRMRLNHGGAARRVKRFFSDAQVAGPHRAGWPVVLADGEIVWIPGIRRTAAASERSGRPVVTYLCERFHRG